MTQFRVRLFLSGSTDPVLDIGFTIGGVFTSYSDLVCEVMSAWGLHRIASAKVDVLNGSDYGVVVSLSEEVCVRLNALA